MEVDKKILEGCINGDRKAQFDLYHLYYGFVLKICLRYQTHREDARWLLNQTFLKVFEKIESYKSDIPFELWIRRIAINNAIDEFRKQKRHREHIDIRDTSESYWEAQMHDTNLSDDNLNADALRALIHALPAISQKVFNLCMLDGYPYEEVATMLEITESTCRWHVHFARKKLQEMVNETFKTTQIIKS